jgi:fucose 4-O-acetylase-like acetyltransferase
MKDDTITSHNKTGGGGQSLLDKPVFKAKEKSYCNKDSRNVTIDILRVLGILLIVLAHINASTGVNAPPPLLFNFRTFDVPMMVFISALSFYSNKPINTWRDYFKYVQKRFVRLVIPTFIFLTFYFLFEWALSSWVPTEDLNLKTMFLSYSMISGIGYVWIIRIFLCEALLAPFLRHGAFLIKEKLWLQILIISASLLIEFGMCYFCNHYLSGKLLTLIGVIFVPIFGYAIIYFFGLLFKQSKTIWQIILIVFCGTALIGVCFVEDIYSIATYKYPPDLIYILYGTTISATLYFILNLIFNNSKNLKILTWLSSNSMDVYYSHIIVLYFYNNSLISSYSWWADYLIVVSISILAVVAKKAFDNHVRPKIARLYGAN